MYKHFVKRMADLILAMIGSVLFFLPMILIAIAIKLDDPGPALFKQKRVGQKKNGALTYFTVWKFRSMKMSAPSETPTHLLENPMQYITRVGRFIRKYSLDELPQIVQVLTSELSFIGPRPCLPSQTDLIEEREKYGANDVKPGITGWAQVNGRDELEISVKARLDGEYAAALNAGHGRGALMDIRCFLRTIKVVLHSEGVREGGTGQGAPDKGGTEQE